MSVVERAIGKLRRNAEAESSQGRSINELEPAIGTLASTGPDGAGHAAEPNPSEHARRILVDRAAVRSAGYLPESNHDRQFADEYRHIKRPIISAALAGQAAGAASPRVVMLASALPEDGKTFTSVNLAFSMAREQDVDVVLVDADVANPQLGRIFGVENERGLLDALADESTDIESLILPTDVQGLSILPAGRGRENATELLASSHMAKLTARIIARSSRRIALFDSSPLLATSESRVLAAVVGQIVLVVRAGKTPRSAVQDALALLGENRPVSLVLNQGVPSLNESFYGYGAYRVYGDNIRQ